MLCEEEAKLSNILRDFKKFTAKQIVVAIEANNKESRKNWLLWLLKPKGEITFWQPDNHVETILSEAFSMRS
ncbi:MAG: hypothetical protein P4L41_11800 [Flavipsychrobacter sp.]|nr:hypothetical protein [Flavipsychrobacter sp.]